MAAGCVAMLLAVFALTTTTNAGSWGVYLLFLLCPAMHLLMHRGGHGHGEHRERPRPQLPAPEEKSLVDERSSHESKDKINERGVSMADHIGIVVKIDSSNYAHVVTDRKGACGECQSTPGGCRSCLASVKQTGISKGVFST